MHTDNQTLILTVHNKGYLISRVLEGISHHTHGEYELIIVEDGSTDDSLQKIESFKGDNPQLNITILSTPNVFETKANNVGLRAATGDIAIIIQDDMVINEHDWNHRLTKPFREFDDVFAVSARSAHNWAINPNSLQIATSEITDCEWSDILDHVDHADKTTTPRDTFAIRQCVNRGPLAINYTDIKNLGFFDEIFAPLDMDDHDLCFRMYGKLNKVVGSYWIDYISEIAWGGTRVSGQPARWHFAANQRNTRIVMERHSELIKDRIITSRPC